MKNEIEKIKKWLYKKVSDAKADGVVFGISGGLDSSVVAKLSVDIFNENALGLIMPIHSNKEDEDDAILLSEKINLRYEKVDLSDTYDTLLSSSFISENLLAKQNIKPRLRMTTLYYYAQDKNYLVLGPTNKSEFYTGYFTKHGDTGCDLMPIVDFNKEEVFKMGEILGLPSKILDKKPSAGLYEGQSDEEDMGFSYKILDSHIEGIEVEKSYKEKIENMHNSSYHKRSMPQIYKRGE